METARRGALVPILLLVPSTVAPAPHRLTMQETGQLEDYITTQMSKGEVTHLCTSSEALLLLPHAPPLLTEQR